MLVSRLPLAPRSLGWIATLALGSACSLTVSLDHLHGGGAGGDGAGGDGAGGSGGSGAGAGGGLVCPAGSEDCDGDGDCEDLATDGTSCGVCGRDCLGGACTEGMCDPVVLWQAPDGTMGNATGIDQSAENVFASTTLGVVRVPKLGGDPLFLTLEPAQPRIDVDGAHAYFTAGSLRRVPLAGGNVDVLAQITGMSGRGVRVDETHAYYIRYDTMDSSQVEVARVPRDGGAEDVLGLTGSDAFGVQLDETNAYVTAATGVYRIEKSTFAAATQIWTGDAGDSFTLHDGFGYLLGAGLWRIDLTTDEAVLLDGELSSGQVATDGQRLYYSLYNTGEVGRLEFDGTGRVPLANVGMGVDVLIVDDDALYFTQHVDVSVFKLAK